MKRRILEANYIPWLLIITIVISAFMVIKNTPEYVEVHMSNTTGKCVKVVSEHNNWSCSNLPIKYTPIAVR